jgi:putative membrane protein
MMWWPDQGGWGWGGWLAMTLTMLAFWGLVAWVVLNVVRQPGGRREPGPDAEEILAQRFARGEIDEDEFRQRREALRAHR